MVATKADLMEEVVNCRKLLIELRTLRTLQDVRDRIDKAFNVELLEFDDLDELATEHAIAMYLKSDTIYEVAIDDLRHMKFNSDGDIVRGYDEE